jgi:phosphatidate cytidylyltransferase
MGCVIQLRILPSPYANSPGSLGLVALLSMIAVVKLSDTGAYFTGRLIGQRKLAPRLSPGKTWEGFLGGMGLALVGALIMLGPVSAWLDCPVHLGWRWTVASCGYAIVVALAGVIGDLSISLVKRDVGVKDSSSWLPGFGGVLDIIDSILVAAPVALACWIFRLVGP